MTDSAAADRAERYRKRAKELRAIAKGIEDAEARDALLNLAASYDNMAAKWAQVERHVGPSEHY